MPNTIVTGPPTGPKRIPLLLQLIIIFEIAFLIRASLQLQDSVEELQNDVNRLGHNNDNRMQPSGQSIK